MFISIIIPTRNRFEYISTLIDDLLHQDVADFEIIVVDQSDRPQAIVHCHHIITTTTGPCVSRNLGAQAAKGDILVFLDDDARVNSDFIRELTFPIIHQGFLAAAGAVCDLEGNYLRSDHSFLQQSSENFIKVLTNNPDSATSRVCVSFPGCCAAIDRRLFFELGAFDETFDPTGAGEDRDLALRLYKNGYPIWYTSKAKLLHAIASEGGSRDVGSRTLMLDVHTYKMCQTYFSEELAGALKRSILRKYQKNFYTSLLEFRRMRTKYRVLQEVKRLLN